LSKDELEYADKVISCVPFSKIAYCISSTHSCDISRLMMHWWTRQMWCTIHTYVT